MLMLRLVKHKSSDMSYKFLLDKSSAISYNVYLMSALQYPAQLDQVQMSRLQDRKTRGGSRAAATSKLECFVIIVKGWKPLIIITKRSILDVAAALDLSLKTDVNVVLPCLFFN